MTSKQRAYLRGLANTMEPIIHVGKDGVNENMIKQLSDALEARELIKGTVLQNCPLSAREAITELCEGANAEPVQCIGNRFVIYRAREKDPKIILPF
ncbi:MAG: ribosome assembly RNA-binding protein YhbY [Clostridia bacterium]|nr:ribosome assembly RNA-binding protein YhbY [Clostridia bacterium]